MKLKWAMQRLLSFMCAAAVALVAWACNHDMPHSEGAGGGSTTPSGPTGGPSADASKVIERFLAIDSSHDSTSKTHAIIRAADNVSRLDIQMTIYRKREPGGRQVMLVDLTSPTEERDRDALITVSPQGDIEATP